MTMTSIKRYYLHQPIQSATTFPAEAYSLMKHGCVDSLRYFANELNRLISDIVSPGTTYQIAATPFVSVPNAANLLLDEVLNNRDYDEFDRVYLRRKKLIARDFAELSYAERMGMSQCLAFDYDKSDFSGRSLIVVDDVRVTGAHERAIVSRLGHIVTEFNFFYLLDLSGCQDAAFESVINTLAIKSIFDILPLRQNRSYTYNSRVLKMLFLSSDDEFRTFLTLIPRAEQLLLMEMIVLEGYQMLGASYQKKCRLMEEICDQMPTDLGLKLQA